MHWIGGLQEREQGKKCGEVEFGENDGCEGDLTAFRLAMEDPLMEAETTAILSRGGGFSSREPVDVGSDIPLQ